VAALVGETIEARVLAAVLGEAPGDHLARAVRDRLLVASEGRPGQYGFAHALIRRVLADEFAPSARAAWHARIAAVLARGAPAATGGAAGVGRHLAAAGAAPGVRAGGAHARRGAAAAARDLGWEEAVRLSEIALDVGARAGLLDAARGRELRLGLARALRGAGDVPAARARCAEVLADCRRTPDPAAFARAALLYAGPMPEFGRIEPAVRAVLEEAWRAGQAGDDALRARLAAGVGGGPVGGDGGGDGAGGVALGARGGAGAR